MIDPRRILGLLLIGTLMIMSSRCSLEKKDSETFLSDAHLAVKETYGDYYLPSVQMTGEELEVQFGLDLDDVDDFIAESPLMSIHLDVFIGIKAKPGLMEEVSGVLEDYLRKMKANLNQLPSNQGKLSSSEIYITGDYVFLLILGEYGDVIASEAIKAINN